MGEILTLNRRLVIEPDYVREIYVDGIVDFSRAGPCTRIRFFTEHQIDGQDAIAQMVNARFIMPTANMFGCMRQAAIYLGHSTVETISDVLRLPH